MTRTIIRPKCPKCGYQVQTTAFVGRRPCTVEYKCYNCYTKIIIRYYRRRKAKIKSEPFAVPGSARYNRMVLGAKI